MSRAWILLAVALTGCAHDVRVDYAGPSPGATGSLQVVLNDATGKLSVTVNDTLVVDRKHSRKARIDNVPAGLATVHVATGGGCERSMTLDREVEVVPGAVTTVALPGPSPDAGCMIYSGLYYVGMNVGLVAIAIIATHQVARPHK
jgi:hypothetical protein